MRGEKEKSILTLNRDAADDRCWKKTPINIQKSR